MLRAADMYVSILQISLHRKSINIQSKWLPRDKHSLWLTDELIESMKRSSKYAHSAHVIVTPRVKRLQIGFLKKHIFLIRSVCILQASRARALKVHWNLLSLQNMFARSQSYGEINLTPCSEVNTQFLKKTFLSI